MFLILHVCLILVSTVDALGAANTGNRVQPGIMKQVEPTIQVGMRRDKVLSLIRNKNYTSFSSGISATYWYPETGVELFFRDGILVGIKRKENQNEQRRMP